MRGITRYYRQTSSLPQKHDTEKRWWHMYRRMCSYFSKSERGIIRL